MPKVPIYGIEYEIDVEAELSEFDWAKARWTADKLIAASPFRYDRKPSFFVRLQPYGRYPAGTWADSGAYDEGWRSGNFVKLLAFLRNETYEETADYLIAKYSVYADGHTKLIRPKIRMKQNRKPLDMRIEPAVTEYLSRRGISAEVQRMFGVGYDEKADAVMLPWRLADGRLANVKYRKTRGKAFWFERNGWPIRELVYGIDLIYAQDIRKAAIVEGEIDAMSFWTAGIPAIAVGGTAFSRVKRDVILRSPIEELVIATDADKPGERLARELEREFSGRLRLGKVSFAEVEAKDANEALVRLGAEKLCKLWSKRIILKTPPFITI